ncbi:hypothetical protein [Streptantibioticus silvisoli]|uniref:Uncharacterized protein n=1 Tax=Streptantibioticus silvisoli TaxID=2705255 RepID=A0ABT6W4X3_9ACTN|nr:hypothetical protein [Streptantibioticus silvisoli]MDI5965776.1 hypothetical protein [Streptantibioticus silvisoli]
MTAAELWDQLLRYQPDLAAQLAHHVRDLPDWALPADHRAATNPNQPPEITPYAASPFDCQACTETGDQCRYHQGVNNMCDELEQAAADNPELTVRAFFAAVEEETYQ